MGRNIKDIMTPGVEVVTPNHSLREAAQRMRELKVGPLPVCDNQKLVGMITDRDIVVRGIAMGHDPNTSKVREVMTEDVEYCYDDDPVETAAKHMQDKKIRRLLVINRNKDLVGIVSLGDLSQEFGERKAGETLGEISEPSQPNR